MDCSMPGFPVLTVSQSLFKQKSIESMMPSNHRNLCSYLHKLKGGEGEKSKTRVLPRFRWSAPGAGAGPSTSARRPAPSRGAGISLSGDHPAARGAGGSRGAGISPRRPARSSVAPGGTLALEASAGGRLRPSGARARGRITFAGPGAAGPAPHAQRATGPRARPPPPAASLPGVGGEPLKDNAGREGAAPPRVPTPPARPGPPGPARPASPPRRAAPSAAHCAHSSSGPRAAAAAARAPQAPGSPRPERTARRGPGPARPGPTPARPRPSPRYLPSERPGGAAAAAGAPPRSAGSERLPSAGRAGAGA